MLQQRALQQSLRRLAATNPSLTSSSVALSRFSSPAVINIGRRVQSRKSTSAANPAASSPDATSLLARQRLARPVSPHLTIYRPQIPWVLSALNRITGAVLSGGFYLFGALYLAAPLVGLPIDSASMAAGFAAWPVLVQGLAKFLVAWPFTFHGVNGVRHLMWDAGKGIANQAVIRSGWVVVGVSLVSALGLAVY